MKDNQRRAMFAKRKGFVIIGLNGRILGGTDKRNVFATKELAQKHLKAVLKNNTREQRLQCGAYGMVIRQTRLHPTGDPARAFWLRGMRMKK